MRHPEREEGDKMLNRLLQESAGQEAKKLSTASWLKYDEILAICDRCAKLHCTGCRYLQELRRYES